MKHHLLNTFLCLSLLMATACDNKTRFELLSAEKTGIDFQNRLEETHQMNVFTYMYYYNGGGVAAGDLNGDGLPDLYFTSNRESNKMYLNKGDFQFVDITDDARVNGQKGWTTGVTMADVNGDGKLDIYVGQLGDFKNIRGKNQLYMNMGNDENGIPQFEDQAEQWGLDLVGFSTQAAFFDYDLDGDLDMFMLNHSVHSNGTYVKADVRSENHPLAGDKLLRNDGGKFVDVTAESGIYSSVIGYGLGVTVGDINWDGYPDIYVGNDFHENDYLYLNNGDGTFTEALESSMGHTSRYSMGNDIGDINNDGLPDILSLDMLPADPVKLKSSAGEDSYEVYHYKLGYGYNHQFGRNTLQLNLGNGSFSEIGLMSGIAATDWSWSGLVTDLDLDGYKDIFITNGIKRRMNDLDFINFVSSEAIQHRLEGDLSDEDLALIDKIPVVKIPNFLYRNNGNLTFQDVSEDWGLKEASFSNGAVYVDLDNDGDQDLVTNNIDQEAFIYKNNTIEADNRENNFIKITFLGEGANSRGIGTKVIIPMKEGRRIINELFPTRGYQSAVNSEMVIGLGKLEVIDSLVVVWPDHTFEVLKGVPVNQQLRLKQANAQGTYSFSQKNTPLFADISDSLRIAYKHEENNFAEFTREPLIPHMTSTEGPRIATGDVNGDGLEDFFIGGAKRQSAEIYLQSPSGFTKRFQEAFRQDSLNEDIGAEFIDVENDGDLDLIVVSGGNEFQKEDKSLLVRLYKNDGKGTFTKSENGLPEIYVTGSCVKAGDFNNDGHDDLFIGGSVVPWNYGETPVSYLLQNDTRGNFTDATASLAPELKSVGMVKDAEWADLDGNGFLDLVLAGEWMPITIFENNEGELKKNIAAGLEESHGWWNTISIADLDNDGNPDLVAGNYGLNSKLKTSKQHPVSLYIKDFDKNGRKEQLLFHYQHGKQTLFATKDELAKQLPAIKNKYMKYADFASADPAEIFANMHLNEAEQLEVYEFRSGVFMNDGNLAFQFKPFPIEAQMAPIKSFHLVDYDADGKEDILAAGNFYEANIQLGRYDANHGTLLKNKGQGDFNWIPHTATSLNIKGQVRDIGAVNYQGKQLLFIVKNNEPIQVIKLNFTTKSMLTKK